MKEEEIKNHIDFKRIGVLTINNVYSQIDIDKDYLMDDKGNYIYPLNPVEFKLIEWIKILEKQIDTNSINIDKLEARIKVLEA